MCIWNQSHLKDLVSAGAWLWGLLLTLFTDFLSSHFLFMRISEPAQLNFEEAIWRTLTAAGRIRRGGSNGGRTNWCQWNGTSDSRRWSWQRSDSAIRRMEMGNNWRRDSKIQTFSPCVWVGVCVLSDYCTQKKEYWIQLNSCFNHPGNVYFSQPTHCFRWTGCELVGHLPAQRPEQNLWCNNNCISTTKYNTRADNLSFKRSWKICNIVVGVTITVSGKMGWNSRRKWSPQTIYKQSLTT